MWRRRRFVYDNCADSFLEDHPEFEGSRPGEDARVMPVSAAARRCGLGQRLVMALVLYWADLAAGQRRSLRCSVRLRQ